MASELEVDEWCITAERHHEPDRIVITRADPHAWATTKIVRDWLTPGKRPDVRVYGDGDVVEFGTPGEGIGVVRYRIGDIPRDDDLEGWIADGHRIEQWYRGVVELTRVDEEW